MLIFDPLQLAALAAVHRRGSFDLAAADLGVTQSAVSQRLRGLEDRAGALLIRRGSPSVATDAGLRLIRHFDDIVLLEQQVAVDLPGVQAGKVALRIAVNADSLATWVMPALAQVPGVLFDLVIDDQDFSQDWLRRGEVVAAVTAHAGPLQGCDTLPLGALRYIATASPGYMDRCFPAGVTAEALAHAPALTFSDKDRLQAQWVAARRLGLRAGFPSHRIASTHGFVDACLLGLGWGLNPEPLVAAHLAAGRLVEMVPDSAYDVALHWQFARLTAGAIRPLTQAMRTAAGQMLRIQ
ncbi:MAG: LysR family transcriptional regulator ArgP [Pseudotabrizicola sp.]|uniref:LysR family transcriptional regulator ArgP n=1 Tax=Pseudotabrizicola sp. TaxID=2939647 RepID=UPI002ACD339B|nr:LysR family transcriptional regulator ArgP [Pseudotabrizicola sp.]MDZ7573359.1 LysR family transcriptional regulator ArgP [Pseudotabrizicola sp.]